ncbi:MAG: hypothetical protein KDD61_04305 [Bdellovibrionales bacterium]|nr:hypothetical protein [Bdellovibrionales bacterium]
MKIEAHLKRNVLAFRIHSFFILIFTAFITPFNNAQSMEKEPIFPFLLINWTVVSQELIEGNLLKQKTLILEKKSTRAHIEIIWPVTSDYAKREVLKSQAIFKRQYLSESLPYQGTVSKHLSCPPQNRPIHDKVLYKKSQIDLFVASATKRYTFGDCSTENAPLIGLFTVFFDAEVDAIIKIKLYGNRAHSQSTLEIKSAKSLLKELLPIQ